MVGTSGMVGTRCMAAGVVAARALAREFLDGERLRHTAGVADRAAELAGTVVDELGDLLVAAAWLHDIGYSRLAVDTGFHPLDGARLLGRLGWPDRISALVAHHSGARFVAERLGLAAELSRYPDERSALSDALTYADQITGPDGRPLPIEQRMAEMLTRHGPSSVNAAAHPERGPYLLAVAGRVRRRYRRSDVLAVLG